MLKLLKSKKNPSLTKISNIKGSLLNQNDVTVVETFISGSNDFIDKENALINESTFEYIIATEKFIAPLI